MSLKDVITKRVLSAEEAAKVIILSHKRLLAYLAVTFAVAFYLGHRFW